MRPTNAALWAPHFFAPLHDEKDGSLLDLVKLMRRRDIRLTPPALAHLPY
ncbi:hypothetical protein K4A87_02080 [Xanthomonas fragariae]|nr:hypothetical protein [Xanthomonas fragariae]UKR52902.1 hypothetical protein K4A87_02080 [Xanthomonas fragariae]